MGYFKILILIGVFIALYYLNLKYDNKFVNSISNLSKLLAVVITIGALFFPKDYDVLPDLAYKGVTGQMPKYNGFKKKRKLSESKKKQVAANQKWTCNDCKRILPASYEIDHIIPLYKGGGNEINNLQALCRNCHGNKTMNDRY